MHTSLKVTVALLAATLLGCGSAPETDDGATPAPASSAPSFLSVGTAPPGGAFFVVGGALAQVLTDNAGDNGWQVTAEATKGTQENIRRLASGELEIALGNAAISHFAVRGQGAWKKPYPIRAVMTLAPNVALFLTKEGSGIEKLADLKGKRVVVGPAGAGFEYFLKPILGAHGVTYDDFTPLHNTQAGAVTMLADGSADAAFLGGAVPTASITQAVTTQKIHFIPFEDAAVEKLLADYPFFGKATIPGGTYRGRDDDFNGMNVGSMHLITSAAVDENVVYELTRTIYENRAQVVEKHPAGKAIKAKVIVRDTGTPFHPGAIRYYREIGIWPVDTAE